MLLERAVAGHKHTHHHFLTLERHHVIEIRSEVGSARRLFAGGYVGDGTSLRDDRVANLGWRNHESALLRVDTPAVERIKDTERNFGLDLGRHGHRDALESSDPVVDCSGQNVLVPEIDELSLEHVGQDGVADRHKRTLGQQNAAARTGRGLALRGAGRAEVLATAATHVGLSDELGALGAVRWLDLGGTSGFRSNGSTLADTKGAHSVHQQAGRLEGRPADFSDVATTGRVWKLLVEATHLIHRQSSTFAVSTRKTDCGKLAKELFAIMHELAVRSFVLDVVLVEKTHKARCLVKMTAPAKRIGARQECVGAELDHTWGAGIELVLSTLCGVHHHVIHLRLGRKTIHVGNKGVVYAFDFLGGRAMRHFPFGKMP